MQEERSVGSYCVVCDDCYDDYMAVRGLFEPCAELMDRPLSRLVSFCLCLIGEQFDNISSCSWCGAYAWHAVLLTDNSERVGRCCFDMLSRAARYITGQTEGRAVYHFWVVTLMGIPRDILVHLSAWIADVMLSDCALLDAIVSCPVDVWSTCAAT